MTTIGLTWYKAGDPGEPMSTAAVALIDTLEPKQKSIVLKPIDSEERLGWHFIPKDERKGLQIKHMTEPQRTATHTLLKAALSEAGYNKTTSIMGLEKLLNEFEEGKGRWARDHERYYVTIFGTPGKTGRWGLSYEGHHLSLNFTVEDGTLVSTTPQFFAANPATIKNENKTGIKVGTQVLKNEEAIGFQIVNSLNEAQAKVAVLSDKAPKEIREAGSAQPPTAAPEGISYGDLTGKQRAMLLSLIGEYANAMPAPIAEQRMNQLHYDGLNSIHFAWAGAQEPGIGHYYRVQGPSFLIEFVNTQPDAAGNPANHIHCVWRDMRGDFDLPIEAK